LKLSSCSKLSLVTYHRTTATHALNKLINANIEAVDQALELIGSLSDLAYQARVDGRSQPGAHIRHILDHYQALRDGFASGLVDYDSRSRQSEVETNRSIAQQELLVTKQWLQTLDSKTSSLQVKSEVSLCECCTVTIDSDQARELLYVLNHTVHHMAYVALLLKFNGIVVNDTIGMAPATASHHRNAG